MSARLKSSSALAATIVVAVGSTTSRVSAISLEVARQCNAVTAKAFPPRVVGNPAAGSAKGDGQAERDYFKKCVAKGGKADDDQPKPAK